MSENEVFMDDVAKIVNRVMDQEGWRGKVLEKMAVELWAEIAGPQIAPHAIAERFQNGTLHIRARSPQWTQEIHFLEARLIASMNGRLRKPIVQHLKVRVTMPPGQRKKNVERHWEDPTFPEKTNERRPQDKPVPTDDDAAKRGREIAQNIEDPEMRGTMERLIASVMRAQDEKKEKKPK